jgi:BirA family transcriptional regulator, biotin operon repressor / biotin---[acetyl-CoA-carboxylase] ligase
MDEEGVPMNDQKLLALFEDKDGEYVSGEMISKLLNVSRTAVWKGIKRLEAEGCVFEASRRLGYRLLGKPSRLAVSDILAKLETKRFGRSIKLLSQVGSTQDAARQLAEEGAVEGALVIAEQQLQGRGRMGRTWLSPYGKGVWMSLVLKPRIPLPYTPQLTLLTAVALCRALRKLTALEIGIKWPNDLLISGKKISGILLESAAEEERLRYVIAGIGISVNLDATDYDDEMLSRVISLKMALGRPVDRTNVITSFLNEYENMYELYQQEGFGPVKTLWEALSISLGMKATLTTPQGVIDGIPVGLADTGALLVKQADGSTISVFSAEMGLPQE